MKKLLLFLCIVSCILALSSCKNDPTYDPSGTDYVFLNEKENESFERYENELLGIIMEYPKDYTKVGNIDIDGFLTFEGDGNVISVFVPDSGSEHLFSAEDYAVKVLGFSKNENSGNVKYGKSNGFKYYEKKGGVTTITFVIKGIDAFYKFSFSSTDKNFSESDPVFTHVMDSIRIDDGIYSRLNLIANRYGLVLEYATSMQYITDANYASHCLKTLESTEMESYRQQAVDSISKIKSELLKITDIDTATREELSHIIEHEEFADRTATDASNAVAKRNFAALWESVITSAKKDMATCDEILAAIKEGNIKKAHELASLSFSYDLSNSATSFLKTINAEIQEY